MKDPFRVTWDNPKRLGGKQTLHFTHVSHAKSVTVDVSPHIGAPPPANLGILLIQVTKILRDINGPGASVPTHEDIARALSKAFEKC